MSRAAGRAPVRTLATFTTARFNAAEVRPHFVNPCCFGEDCAAWLVAELRAGGADADDPWQEDWGWQAGVRLAGGACLVGVGLLEDDPGAPAAAAPGATWLVTLEESRSLLGRLRARAGTPPGGGPLPALVRAVDAVLRAAPQPRDARWHHRDAFDRGRDEGSPDPFAP